MSNSCRRRSPRRSTSSRSSTRRGARRSASVVPGRPFHGMSAAVRWCSTRRAYGRCAGQSTAIRSNGGARSCGVDDETGGFAHFFVGIGGGDDCDGTWTTSSETSPVSTHGVGGTECVEELAGVGVGGGVSGELCDDADVDLLAERAHERDRSPGQLLGEVEHEAAQPVGCGGADGLGRGGEQVGFVVPAFSRVGVIAALMRTAWRPRSDWSCRRCDVGRVGEAQFGVEVAERDHRRGVGGDGNEGAGVVGQECSDGEVDHRGRHRRPSGGGQQGTGDQFGEAVEGDHVDPGHPTLAPECSPSHHPAGVGGHCHGDRCEGIVSLGGGDRRGERPEGPLGSDEGGRDRHVTDRREGVSQSWPTIAGCRSAVPRPTTDRRCASRRCGPSSTIR